MTSQIRYIKLRQIKQRTHFRVTRLKHALQLDIAPSNKVIMNIIS